MSGRNDLDTPTAEREHKGFATLAAQCALLGFVLIKGDSAVDGQALYYAMRLGQVEPFDSLEAVAQYVSALVGTRDVSA